MNSRYSWIKNSIWGLSSFIIFLLFFFAIGKFFTNADRQEIAVLEPVLIDSAIIENTQQQPVDEDIKIIFVGDIMLSRGIGMQMVKNNDWKYPFLNAADFLNSADLTFGNLEGPISDGGANVGSIYSFRADSRSVDGLTYAGFDVVSFANNHVWDYGQDAFKDTLHILDESGIAHAGAGLTYGEAHIPAVKDVRGTKVAFLAYTNLQPEFLSQKDAEPAVAFPDIEQMMQDIQNAKSLADIVIVSFHFGDEYKMIHNALQESIAHAAIDAGADFVVGHHPHVAEDIETYKGKYIAYSVGNFVFDQNFSPETAWGLALTLTISDKKISNLEQHKVVFNSSFQPSIENLQ